MIRLALISGIAHPIFAGSIDVRVLRGLDLLTARGNLLEAPLTFPALAAGYIRRVRRRGRWLTYAAHAVITGTAAPLPIENLEGTPAGDVPPVLHAKSRNLPVAIVAGPALLASGGVGIERDVAMAILRMNGAHPPHCADQYQTE